MVTLKQTRSALTLLRLALGGAILGVAVIGLVGNLMGAENKTMVDTIGALLGGAGSAAVAKALHVV